MKASPNKQAVSSMVDRPPRVLVAGKSNTPPGKASAAYGKKQLSTKQPPITGTAKRPQYL